MNEHEIKKDTSKPAGVGTCDHDSFFVAYTYEKGEDETCPVCRMAEQIKAKELVEARLRKSWKEADHAAKVHRAQVKTALNVMHKHHLIAEFERALEGKD